MIKSKVHLNLKEDNEQCEQIQWTVEQFNASFYCYYIVRTEHFP